MLNKMISFVEVNTSVMFQYIIVLLLHSKAQFAVLMKTTEYFSTSKVRVLGSLIIYRVNKLIMILQQAIKLPTGVSHKKGINKKLLFGAAQGLNLQFLNLFGFSISVSFVWCII